MRFPSTVASTMDGGRFIAPGKCECAYTIGASASTSANASAASIFSSSALASIVGRSIPAIMTSARSSALHAFREPDDVAFGICEQGDRHLRQLRHRPDRLPPELLDFGGRRLRVAGPDVAPEVPVAGGRLTDSAADASVLLLDHRIRRVARRPRRLPAEDVGVELLQLPQVLAG